jgi:hypothetical protein
MQCKSCGEQADLRQLVRGLIAAGQVVHPPVVD